MHYTLIHHPPQDFLQQHGNVRPLPALPLNVNNVNIVSLEKEGNKGHTGKKTSQDRKMQRWLFLGDGKQKVHLHIGSSSTAGFFPPHFLSLQHNPITFISSVACSFSLPLCLSCRGHKLHGNVCILLLLFFILLSASMSPLRCQKWCLPTSFIISE